MSAVAATDRVPCAPLAEAIQRSPLSLSEIGHRMGWNRRHAAATLQRAVGLRKSKNGAGKFRLRTHMPVEQAARLCEVLGVDPVEVGL